MISFIENKVAEIHEIMVKNKATSVLGEVEMANGNKIKYNFKIKLKRV